MKIRGTAFLGRKVFIIQSFGQDVWDRLIADIVQQQSFFQRDIMPITLIEEDEFLKFNDYVVGKLYGGDKNIYWTFGEESAKWALQEGPLKAFMASKKIENFIGTVPHMWKSYYTEGHAEVRSNEKNIFELEIGGVELRHVYYEYTTFGFLKSGLILAGASQVGLDCLRGFSKGDNDIFYRVSVKL